LSEPVGHGLLPTTLGGLISVPRIELACKMERTGQSPSTGQGYQTGPLLHSIRSACTLRSQAA